ncbi:hypothetical protein FHK71_002176, partial [Neisseria gonorrhoeae]
VYRSSAIAAGILLMSALSSYGADSTLQEGNNGSLSWNDKASASKIEWHWVLLLMHRILVFP